MKNGKSALASPERLDEAVAQFRTAVQASPSDPQAHLCLGLALEKKRNWPAAYEEFKHASELDPHLSEPWRGQGATLLRMKKPAEAEAAYRKAVDIDHKYPVAVLGLGEALVAEGK